MANKNARFVRVIAVSIVVFFEGCDSRPAAGIVDASSDAPDGASRTYTCPAGQRCKIEVPAAGCETWEIAPPLFPGGRRSAEFGDHLVVTFTPVAADIGQHELTATCRTDDGQYQEQTITVIVQAGRQPFFVRPLGLGLTHDVDQVPCLELDVLVEDADSDIVSIVQHWPISNSELEAKGPKAAVFRWCPDDAERASARRVLFLVADDGDHPPVTINDGAGFYLLLK